MADSTCASSPDVVHVLEVKIEIPIAKTSRQGGAFLGDVVRFVASVAQLELIDAERDIWLAAEPPAKYASMIAPVVLMTLETLAFLDRFMNDGLTLEAGPQVLVASKTERWRVEFQDMVEVAAVLVMATEAFSRLDRPVKRTAGSQAARDVIVAVQAEPRRAVRQAEAPCASMRLVAVDATLLHWRMSRGCRANFAEVGGMAECALASSALAQSELVV